eukprot:385703_1
MERRGTCTHDSSPPIVPLKQFLLFEEDVRAAPCRSQVSPSQPNLVVFRRHLAWHLYSIKFGGKKKPRSTFCVYIFLRVLTSPRSSPTNEALTFALLFPENHTRYHLTHCCCIQLIGGFV